MDRLQLRLRHADSQVIFYYERSCQIKSFIPFLQHSAQSVCPAHSAKSSHRALHNHLSYILCDLSAILNTIISISNAKQKERFSHVTAQTRNQNDQNLDFPDRGVTGSEGLEKVPLMPSHQGVFINQIAAANKDNIYFQTHILALSPPRLTSVARCKTVSQSSSHEHC